MTSTGSENRRHFLVARMGDEVVIREVAAGTCASTFTREGAWNMAAKLAKKVDNRNAAKRAAATKCIFIDLEMNSKEIRMPEAQVAIPATVEAPKPVAPANAPWVTLDPRNKEAYDYLNDLNLAGRLNNFTYSLHEQLAKRGKLTDNQRDALLRNKRPVEDKPKVDMPDVPAGHYAIEVDGEADNIVTKFYRVDRPTEGKWAGYTFVKVQASDDLFPVKGAAAQAVLNQIANDPQAASLRYGREIGKCGVCNRTLTDEASRAAGIGPICADKMGW